MEGLLLFFLGPLVGIVGAIATTLISLLASAFALLVEPAIVAATTKQRSDRSVTGQKCPRKTRDRKRWKRIAVTIILALLLILLAANALFFGHLVGGIAKHRLERHGVSITYSRLDGSFLSGVLEIKDLQLDSDDWSISIDSIEADLGIWSLLSPKRKFQRLSIEGLRSECTIPDEGTARTGAKKSERPQFVIQNLSVRDASVQINGGESIGFPRIVEIYSLDSSRFHSRWALLSLLFRSDFDGAIDGYTTNGRIVDYGETGKHTEFHLEKVPLGTATDHSLQSWFESGYLSATVTDEWDIDDWRLETDFEWKLVFHDAVLDRGMVNRPILGPVVCAFNESENPKVIAFSLKMSPEELEGSASDTFAEILSALTESILQTLTKESLSSDQLERRKDLLFDTGKELLDEAREEKQR